MILFYLEVITLTLASIVGVSVIGLEIVDFLLIISGELSLKELDN